jgi:orotate phosphoribosyltransferase
MDDLLRLIPAKRGHFQYESGHHGDLWLDLERLCLDVGSVRKCASDLAQRLAGNEIEVVCGPLVEGAFVALLVAESLRVPFTYTNRIDTHADSLFPIEYRLPEVLHAEVRGRRIAIVNDVISAGSSVRGTIASLLACGARPVAIGALVVLGDSPARLADEHSLALEALASLSASVWVPAECPLCADGSPLSQAPPSA